jgi:predicted nucleic acid-binding protein
VSAFVLDASIALAWCFEDEADAATDALLARVLEEGAAAPTLFPLEFGNALLAAERRGRIARDRLDALVERIATLPLALAPAASLATLPGLLTLARQERLTIYDATYLALAFELGLPLATRDGALATAATRRGVATLGSTG